MKSKKSKGFLDDLYAAPLSKIEDFVFDEKVTSVFEEMIHRSVPGYLDVVKMIGVLSERYTQPQSRLYDLGCSLGAVTLMARHFLDNRDCQIIAVDNSKPMIEKCLGNLETQHSSIPVKVLCKDIREVPIQKASFVVLNFTLQFIPVKEREKLLKKIYKGMLPGGTIVISEKVKFSNKKENKFQTELHHSFKKLHGYSDLEISQKRTALEKVMVPETMSTHLKRLEKIGFKASYHWFQCFNFSSIIAFKDEAKS